MKRIINQVHKLLIRNKKTIAVAESCTGGLLSNLLTRIPGSSKYFILGVVVYSNQAKENILKIPANIIDRYGAVSKDVARLMAKSVRAIAKTDFGIGVTGIAGPSRVAFKKNPVGTVFIALESKNKKLCKKFHFAGNRLTVRKKAALKALELLSGLI